MASGGFGVSFGPNCTNAIIMNNNFGNAGFRGIGFVDAAGSLQNASIFRNILGEGVSFHAQVDYTNSFGWFLNQNTYLNSSSNSLPPFLDPAASSVHVSN
jgi:hypothetical protein